MRFIFLLISTIIAILLLLTIEVESAEAPKSQFKSEITDLNKDTNSVLISPISLPPTTCEQYKNIIRQYDWDDDVAIAVMMAEGGCNPEVVNWNDKHATCIGSTGLFQIACVNAPVEQMKDPVKNIAKAYAMYKSSGWQPWSAYKNNSYLKYL